MVVAVKKNLVGLALCAVPLLVQAQAQENCTSPNTNADYILGAADGTASAMHWETGLVWKRCLEGQTFVAEQCTGTALLQDWNTWAFTHLPKSFNGQSTWGIDAGLSQNLLQSGRWRMAYKKELWAITNTCNSAPFINSEVFLNTPSSVVWSGSPLAGNPSLAWLVDFNDGSAYGLNRRNNAFRVRLVRGGQSFAPLSGGSTSAIPGQQQAFDPITLAPSDIPGQAWGGARISGAGDPEFQVNGGPWVQQAIVQSGDAITVRLTAPASGFSTATLTVRSGQTTGTSADATNGGDEATVMQETTASFELRVTAYPITATASPTVGGTVSCNPSSPVTHGGSSTCTATPQAGYSFTGFSGDCTGQTCTLSNVTAAKSVTAAFTQNTYAITTTASPLAGGTVSCSPSSVPHGGGSTCTATAHTGYRFHAWTGACASHTTASCTLNNIQTAQTATAVFAHEITVQEGPQQGRPIVVSPPTPSDWAIADVSARRTSSIATPPPSTVELPYGIVSLELTGGTVASTATVVLTYPEPLPAGTTYYKFGKTQANPTDHWYEFGGAVISGNTITLTLADGGAGDSDLAENGKIEDPGGPGRRMLPTAAQPIPTLSEWAMLLLTGLLGLMAAAAMRRGKNAG